MKGFVKTGKNEWTTAVNGCTITVTRVVHHHSRSRPSSIGIGRERFSYAITMAYAVVRRDTGEKVQLEWCDSVRAAQEAGVRYATTGEGKINQLMTKYLD